VREHAYYNKRKREREREERERDRKTFKERQRDM